MQSYSLSHVGDAVLVRDLVELVAQDRSNTAALLAHIAEMDARRLYAPAGHSSMFAYCVDELRLSEDAAFRRIRAARAARQFPVLFSALAEGRLHLAAVSLLAPHLTDANVGELIAAATAKRKAEIEEFLARRFGSAEEPPRVRIVPVGPAPSGPQLVPGRVARAPETVTLPLAPGRVEAEAEKHSSGNDSRGDSKGSRREEPPLSSERFLVQVTIPKSTRDKLRQAQALLSHAVPAGDVAQVLDRALDALITQLEKQKMGTANARPRRVAGARTRGTRYIPAHVRRAVWDRDQGQCTFVGANGHRCRSRSFLELDHVEPLARGGDATVANLRLRCRTHNQYEAERSFGSEFMHRKREEARIAATSRCGQSQRHQ